MAPLGQERSCLYRQIGGRRRGSANSANSAEGSGKGPGRRAIEGRGCLDCGSASHLRWIGTGTGLGKCRWADLRPCHRRGEVSRDNMCVLISRKNDSDGTQGGPKPWLSVRTIASCQCLRCPIYAYYIYIMDIFLYFGMPNSTCARTPYYYTFTSKCMKISILRAPTSRYYNMLPVLCSTFLLDLQIKIFVRMNT